MHHVGPILTNLAAPEPNYEENNMISFISEKQKKTLCSCATENFRLAS